MSTFPGTPPAPQKTGRAAAVHRRMLTATAIAAVLIASTATAAISGASATPRPALRDERLEAVRVGLASPSPQQVAAPAGDQQPLTEHPAQVRNVPLNDLDRARGCVLPPQRIDQAIGGDRLAAMHEQHRQQRPLLGAAER